MSEGMRCEDKCAAMRVSGKSGRCTGSGFEIGSYVKLQHLFFAAFNRLLYHPIQSQHLHRLPSPQAAFQPAHLVNQEA